MHGTRDETVPFDQGERLHQVLTEERANSRFVPIEGGFHNLRDAPDIPYASPVWDQVGELTVEFFRHALQTQ